MLEEVRDLLGRDRREVVRGMHVAIQRRELVDRHGEDLRIAAGFVLQFQHADRPAAHDHARDQRHRREHEHVGRIAVVGKRARNVAVVAGIVHRRRHETIDEHRTGFLVDLVLDRIAAHRDLDDHVAIVRNVAAGGDTIEVHRTIIGGGRALTP